jgi:hypothetical protein
MRIVLAIALLLTVGCRRSEDQTTIKTPEGVITMEDGQMTIKTEQGTTSIQTGADQTRIQTSDGTLAFGQNALPEGFPLAVMPGSKVEHSSHMKRPGRPEAFQVNLSTPGNVEQIAGFYEKALTEKNLSVSRTEQSANDTRMIMLIGESDAANGTVMIIQDPGDEGPKVMISWSMK